MDDSTMTDAFSPTTTSSSNSNNRYAWPIEYVDRAIGIVASSGRRNLIDHERERELIQMAIKRDDDLLLLAKHYGGGGGTGGGEVGKFLEFSTLIPLDKGGDDPPPAAAVVAAGEGAVSNSNNNNSNQEEGEKTAAPDAIVVGSGLAGLAATLNLLDRGGRVVLIDKEHLIGGNSNKASSGINACCPPTHAGGRADGVDSVEIFRNDTIRSAGSSVREDLIDTLVSGSRDAVMWLKDRVGVDLSLLAQLGGHSASRTHRPSNGMAGAEIIFGMQKAVRKYEASGQVRILLDTKVTRLITSDDGDGEDGTRVVGVEYVPVIHDSKRKKDKNGEDDGDDDTKPVQLLAPNVVLATGGFASDRSEGSYMEKYRPDLLNMATTAGGFSTGDGVALATALGANVVDMDKVQIHPTGWVDPANPGGRTKTLAAELMRGVGGILLNERGERFCNELGTRAYVTDRMLSHDRKYKETGRWDPNSAVPTFAMVLSSSAAAVGNKHVQLYTHKGLMTKIVGVDALSKWMNVPKATLRSTLEKYRRAANVDGIDEFGKTVFKGVPGDDPDAETFHVGMVTPVLHYCMGGITIDANGNVLDGRGRPIRGLHGAGEVTGGVHGVNRLGGNSLLECTVYGTIVGRKLPIDGRNQQRQREEDRDPSSSSSQQQQQQQQQGGRQKLRDVPSTELQQHNTREDCWVSIHGIVYDLTDFVDEHPAGAESIYELAGRDGTDAFDAVHNRGLLDDFEDDRIGTLVAVPPPSPASASAVAEAEGERDRGGGGEEEVEVEVEGNMQVPSSTTEKVKREEPLEEPSSNEQGEGKNDEKEMMPTTMPTSATTRGGGGGGGTTSSTSSTGTSEPPVATRLASLARSIFR